MSTPAPAIAAGENTVPSMPWMPLPPEPPRILTAVDQPVLSLAKTIIEYLARGVEFAAALIIAIAAVRATVQSLRLLFTGDAPPEAKVAVRLTLGRWLAVALEFELAADVLNTAVTPTWADIEKLAAIAALRTALNYFLEKEIREESKPEQQGAEVSLHAHQQLAER